MSKGTEASKELTAEYWNSRYLNQEIGWDIGEASRPLVEFAKTLSDKEIEILIPGAGRAWEVGALMDLGFKHVYVVDWAKAALEAVRQRCAQLPESHLIQSDFFKLDKKFDLVLEQTFFCALAPQLREAYVTKMHEVIRPGGYLAGVMFNFPLTAEGPPFGGSAEEYQSLFNPYFEIEIMEDCYNSIDPRQGRELFVKMRRRDD